MPKKDKLIAGKATTYQIPNPAGGVKLETFIPWTLVKRGVKKQVITPLDAPEQFQAESEQEKETRKAEQDSPLMKALGQAHYWQRLLHEGKFGSFADIAAAEGVNKAHVIRICRLVHLAPEITEACMTSQSVGLTLERLMRQGVPREWETQRELMMGSMNNLG